MPGWGDALKGAGRPRGPCLGTAWKHTVRRAALRRDRTGIRAIDRAAATFVALAALGDMVALKHVADRQDGQPETPDGWTRGHARRQAPQPRYPELYLKTH